MNLLLITIFTFFYIHWKKLDQYISNEKHDMAGSIKDREYQR